MYSVFIEQTPFRFVDLFIMFLRLFLGVYCILVHIFLFFHTVVVMLISVSCRVSSWREARVMSTLPLIILVELLSDSQRFRDWPRIQLQEIPPGLQPDGHSFTNELLDGNTGSTLKVISWLDVVHQVLAVCHNRLPSAIIFDLVGVTSLEPQLIQDGFLGVAKPCWEVSGALADDLLLLTVGRKSKRENRIRESYAKEMKWAGARETSSNYV